MALCVIPARGGSKRIPNKNARPFHGKPMICWSIEAALKSECFEQIIVSTDSDEIASIASSAGASVPFRRPAELSDDYAPTIAVVNHAVEMVVQGVETHSEMPVCCLYATAPFVVSADIQAGLEKLSGHDFVIPVTTYAHPIQRAVKVSDSGFLEMFDAEAYAVRSQDLEEAWHDCGQFYWGTVKAWARGESPYSARSAALPIPRWRVQDIDTEEDWLRAERLFSALTATSQ